MTDAMRSAVAERRSSAEMRRIMVEEGGRTLRDDGLRLVRIGLTTPEEVTRAAGLWPAWHTGDQWAGGASLGL